MSTDNTMPTTIFECPDWCDGPPAGGHVFTTEAGLPVRLHEHVIDRRTDGFYAWLWAAERITPAGPVLGPVTISCDASSLDGLCELTPVQVRDLATALVLAADEADAIEARR